MLAEPVVALGISIDIVTPGILFDNIFLDTVDSKTFDSTEKLLQ